MMGVLVEVEKFTRVAGGVILAQVQTPFGSTALCWCGAVDATPGPYQVEWTIEQDIVWADTAKLAAEHTAAVVQKDHCVLLRGRLNVTDDGAAVFDLGGTLILLDLTGPAPAQAASSWIELHLEQENISVYPFEL